MNNTYELRAHRLDFAFDMAVTLDRIGRKDIVLSNELRGLLNEEPTVEDANELTSDDLLFLELLFTLSWKIRNIFEKLFQVAISGNEDSIYAKDVTGTNPKEAKKIIDQLTVATCKSILAVFLPQVVLYLGDILDSHCLLCAGGDHCTELKGNDRAILIQLDAFSKGKTVKTPANQFTYDEPGFHGENDTILQFPSEVVRDFLFDRTNDPFVAEADLEDGVILLSLWHRFALMASKKN